MSGLFIPLSWEDQMDTGAQGRGQGSIPPPFQGRPSNPISAFLGTDAFALGRRARGGQLEEIKWPEGVIGD